MVVAAKLMVVLGIAGAVASWVVGSLCYARGNASWIQIVCWPFTGNQLNNHNATLNKARVALIACILVAVSATSIATNLSRLSR
ncbi:MAG TPA: hypothetical protein VHN11_09335 [Xanthobacteraceae bacterium]|jgi:hypothetical protein|nr:hypothetical protein [Xanthobacteraceae bacterium]